MAGTTGLATQKGLVLNEDDLRREWVLRELMCHQVIHKTAFNTKFNLDFDAYFANELNRLQSLEQDGLVAREREQLRVTPLGRLFLRNIGMIFDTYLTPKQKRFSKTL